MARPPPALDLPLHADVLLLGQRGRDLLRHAHPTAPAGRCLAAFGADVLPELGRDLQAFNVDADGSKPPAQAREAFFAVDYIDLHLLKPNAAIGLHRHRDNQELFMVIDGKALMITGDWAAPLGRERALEVRTLLPGDMVLIKGGELHALANSLDENVLLFMFGGYD